MHKFLYELGVVLNMFYPITKLYDNIGVIAQTKEPKGWIIPIVRFIYKHVDNTYRVFWIYLH